MSEPAFSAPAAHQPLSFWQFYIDRNISPDDDIQDAAESIAMAEGYKLIRYAHKDTPVLNGTKILRTLRIVVEPAYSGKTGVPGCCEPNAIPDHYPNPTCRSGKRPHCTCDGCF